MSKHFHKYRNKKLVGTHQEVGAKNALMTGWCLGMLTAGIILIIIGKSYENSEKDDSRKS